MKRLVFKEKAAAQQELDAVQEKWQASDIQASDGNDTQTIAPPSNTSGKLLKTLNKPPVGLPFP